MLCSFSKKFYIAQRFTIILRQYHHLYTCIIKIVWPNKRIPYTIHLPSHDFDFEHACSRKRKICTTFKNRQRTNFKVLLWYSMWSKGWKGYRVTWLWAFNHKVGDNVILSENQLVIYKIFCCHCEKQEIIEYIVASEIVYQQSHNNQKNYNLFIKTGNKKKKRCHLQCLMLIGVAKSL